MGQISRASTPASPRPPAGPPMLSNILIGIALAVLVIAAAVLPVLLG